MELNRAVDAAFAAIETVQQLMSFHDPASEVSELNRVAVLRPVHVSAWTHEVLVTAQMLAVKSNGAFDITIAPLLQRWGYLPRHGKRASPLVGCGWPLEIELQPHRNVRFRRPLRIDFGGIAKGFAVDRAIAVLQASGATSGCVNAGGDLRVFGSTSPPIHVRHPLSPGNFLPVTLLANSALATSGPYFTRKRWRGRWVTPLVDSRHKRACVGLASVSVQAPTCLLADALTKVVLTDGRVAPRLLREFHADVFFVTRHGEIKPLYDET